MEAPRKKLSSASSSSSSSITNLPSYILMEIVHRLPVKTLVASKCVCKSWLHLISDPGFMKLHQARVPIEVCFYNIYEGKIAKLYMVNFNVLNSSRSLDTKIHTIFCLEKFKLCPDKTIDFNTVAMMLNYVNSCNGLVCFSSFDYNFAVIWNPITGEAAAFPAPETGGFWSVECAYYGLGFSTKSNRFKLLRLVGRKEREMSEEVVVAEICTIEKGCSWKTLGPLGPFPCFDVMHSIFLQGALHWLDLVDEDSLEIAMFSFDFEDDRLGKVPLPLQLRKVRVDREKLGVLAGCLFITEITDGGVNIWLMKEYGVQDSWTKVLSLEFPRKSFFTECVVPLSDHNDGSILLRSSITNLDNSNRKCYMFFCNPALESIRAICNPALRSIRAPGTSFNNHKIIAFRPSLIPLRDSLMGYDVHVEQRRPVLKHKQITTTPRWLKSKESGVLVSND